MIPIHRPLSLFGLTANMQGYEPGDIKPLNKTAQGANDPTQSVTCQLHPNLGIDEDSDNMDELADYEEL